MFNCKSTKHVKYHYGHFPVVVTLCGRLQRRIALFFFFFRLVSLKMSLHSWTVSRYNFRRAAIWRCLWSVTIFRNYSVPECRLISFSQEQLTTYSYAPNCVQASIYCYKRSAFFVSASNLNSIFNENWPLLGHYATCSVIFIPTFRDRDCPETSVKNYRYSLRNDPEERSSHPLRGGSLKSRRVSNFVTS